MRTRLLPLTSALLLAVVAPATAQDAQQGQAPEVGSFDFGGRFSNVDGDEARFQRYRDLRDGAFLENFRYNRERENWLFDAKATHVGYRDQRYQANFNRFGKVKGWFEWDQIPLF